MSLEPQQLGHVHPAEMRADPPCTLVEKRLIDKFGDMGQAQHACHKGPAHLLQFPWETLIVIRDDFQCGGLPLKTPQHALHSSPLHQQRFSEPGAWMNARTPAW